MTKGSLTTLLLFPLLSLILNPTSAQTAAAPDCKQSAQVNQVLLPLSIFGTHPPAAAPAPIEAKKEKSKPTSEAPAASDDANTDTTSNSATRSGIDRSAVRVAFIGSLYLVAWWALC